ncbi:hypothetical protein Q3G72_029262 [Acer saccharum]|nr:hypothetical protein Q3G72_029262 [Acer saccharum]
MVKVTIAAEELATRTAVQNLAHIVCGIVRIEMYKEVNSATQSGLVDEEVAEVLATGRVIGFDFSKGGEEEVMEASSRRKEEDKVRFEALSV